MTREEYVAALRVERAVKLSRGASTVDVDAELARLGAAPLEAALPQRTERAVPPRPRRTR